MMCKPMYESHNRLQLYGPRFIKLDNYHNNVVHLITDEGCVFTLNNSCYVEDPTGAPYIWVFTEHNGDLIFAKDEVVFVAQYKKTKGNEIVYIEK